MSEGNLKRRPQANLILMHHENFEILVKSDVKFLNLLLKLTNLHDFNIP